MKTKNKIRIKTWLFAVAMFFSVTFFSTGCDLLLYLIDDTEQTDNHQNNTNTDNNDDGGTTSKGKKQGG